MGDRPLKLPRRRRRGADKAKPELAELGAETVGTGGSSARAPSPNACTRHGWKDAGPCPDCKREADRSRSADPPPTEADVESWLTGGDVVALGASSRQLARWTEAHVVRRAKDGSGQWRYSRPDVEAALAGSQKKGEGRDEVLDTLRATVAMLMGHLETSFRMIHEPSRQVQELLQRENARLSTQCDTLQEKHLDMLEVFEKLMTAQHERELERSRVESVEARKDRAFERISEAAPELLQQVVQSLGGSNLLRSIDDAQIAVLCMAEFLTPAQRQILEQEQKRREKSKAKAPTETPAESSSANGAPKEQAT